MSKNSVYRIGHGLLESVGSEFYGYWEHDKKPFIIADHNTWALGGKAILQAFEQKVDYFLFPDSEPVFADYSNVVTCRRYLQEDPSRIAIALGSGTINDLVKLASYELEQSYMLIPTAPSVDGYTAVGSALSVEGFKRTVYCPPPDVIIADLDILCNAPSPMIASGYGDLAAKVTGGADWLIADTLGIEPVVEKVWLMVQKNLRTYLNNPYSLAERDPQAIEFLFNGLVDSGYAIREYIDSRPASGAEHLMSHVWEMDHLAVNGEPVSHGFKVSIGTLSITALMQELLAMSKEDISRLISEHPLESWEKRQSYIDAILENDPAKDEIKAIYQEKFCHGQQIIDNRSAIIREWDCMKQRIQAQIIPFDELREKFKAVGCPVEPKDIALTQNAHVKGFRKAQLIRKRYTCLDLVYEIGALDTIIHSVVHSGKYFNQYL